MHRNTKVATCHYCGTRAALVLDKGRHELACAGCGAPLHDLKAMPLRKAEPAPTRSSASRGPVPARPRTPAPPWSDEAPDDWRRRKKPRKKRKSLLRKAMSEAIDLIEDIFD